MLEATTLRAKSIPSGERARGEAKEETAFARIGRDYGKIASQVSLRWLVQERIPAIPRTSQIGHLHENSSIFDFELSEVEMSEISATARRRTRLGTMMSPFRTLALRVLPEPRNRFCVPAIACFAERFLEKSKMHSRRLWWLAI